MYEQIHNRKELEKFRKKNRNNSTSAEAFLWTLLKGKKLDGRKFRRQHSVGFYILDFYCPSEKLAIELDGQYHYTTEGMLRDEERTKYLNSLNIRVVRFENEQVFRTPEAVLQEIGGWFKHPGSCPERQNRPSL